MSGRAMAGVGGAIFLVAAVLMAVGAVLPLFLCYAAAAAAGAGLASYGLKKEKEQTFARLEQERRGI